MYVDPSRTGDYPLPMSWLFVAVAIAGTPRVTPMDGVRGDATSGFEIRRGSDWLSVPRLGPVDEVEVRPIGEMFLLVEKSYEGGNGLGCEEHRLTVLELQDGELLRRPQPVIELGTACWSRDHVRPVSTGAAVPEGLVASPFLTPVVVDSTHFDLVRKPVQVVMPASGGGIPLTGRVLADSVGRWTVGGERVPGR